MFHHVIAFRPRGRELRLASGAAALVGHVLCLVAVLWATLCPKAPARAAPAPVVLAWPDRAAQSAPGTPLGVPVLEGLPGPIPVNPPVNLPPIDAGTIFDPADWLHEAGGSGRAGQPGVVGDSEITTLSDEPPALLAGPRPTYPELLRVAGIAGRVVVQAVVDTLGRAEPGSVVVIASANSGFDAAARASVLGATFRPARVHGRAVRVRVLVPLEFTLGPRGR
ncbi:MAG TPA: energy transducer TonB [Gemmatimonadales bacterium]|nr:energy transducer TonB [Gemmatimonadales bacterium]